MPWREAVVAGAVAVGLLALIAAGVTDAFGTDARIAAQTTGSVPDGAAPDTFWDSSMIDIPGLSLYLLHCHGQARLDIQIGATGPVADNPCYAAMGAYTGQREQLDTVTVIPAVGKAVYRRSVDEGHWTYYVGDIVTRP